jgi:hypothetical protein
MSKVAFACASIETLRRRLESRVKDGAVPIVTRFMPKRADELIGGSLYWIVKHRLIACQQILRLEDREDGRIDIVCSAELVTVAPMPRRAHQGWRYLEEGDAPSGDDGTGLGALPPQLYGRLAALALV